MSEIQALRLTGTDAFRVVPATMCDDGRMDPFTLWRLFRADLNRYESPSTAQLYRRTSFAAVADLGGDPRDWTPHQLRTYLDEQTPANEKLKRQALNAYLKWLVDKGHMIANPLADAPRRRRRRGRRLYRALTLPEYEALLVELARPPRQAREDFVRARQRILLMVRAQRYTGLRPGEICELDRREVFLRPDREPRIEFIASKTDDERFVPLSDRAHEVFEALCHARVGRLSNVRERSYWEVVHKAAIRAGLPEAKQRPYSLRHMFAQDLLDAGVSDDKVAQLMGHTDTRTLRHYTTRTYKQLRAAVEVLQ